jgi:protoporphyrinogen oxidase
MTVTILGAGLAGLSCSYHIGHEQCLIFERKSYVGGHVATHQRDGCFWDEGPHVSFTRNDTVRALLAASVRGNLLEYPTSVANWFDGHWIPHPAQSNLYAVPQPLASRCLEDFLSSRPAEDNDKTTSPAHYGEWLGRAFGSTFAHTFSAAYTRKYWTCNPEQLAVDWVGERVYQPDRATVQEGYVGPASRNTHYITSVRYPETGGFVSFAHGLAKGARVRHGHTVSCVDLETSTLHFANGHQHSFDRLINTLPLDQFIGLIPQAPAEIRSAAAGLCCSSLLLVNIRARGPSRHPFHWLYVYDEDKLSTRITQTHLLSPNNTPAGSIGIQVEVYASPYRPFTSSHEVISAKVLEEVREMGLAHEIEAVHTHFVPYANVIFDNMRRDHQNAILNWLSNYGLQREDDDLDPMTNWNDKLKPRLGPLNLAGRFGQWKYYWSDDCILRGAHLSSF